MDCRKRLWSMHNHILAFSPMVQTCACVLLRLVWGLQLQALGYIGHAKCAFVEKFSECGSTIETSFSHCTI